MAMDPKSERVLSTLAQVEERMAQGVDHFALLGLERRAAEAEISRAYKELCVLLHPDRAAFRDGGKSERAAKAFQAVSKAYGVLGNAQKRADYLQQLLHQTLRHSGGQPSPTEALQRLDEAIARRDWAGGEKLARELMGRDGVALGEVEIRLAWCVCNNTDHPAEARDAEATMLWQRVVDREVAGPLFARAACHLAQAARAHGDLKGARQWVERCLATMPNHVDGRRLKRLLDSQAAAVPETPTSPVGRAAEQTRALLRRVLGRPAGS